jgi:hypothetical protein
MSIYKRSCPTVAWRDFLQDPLDLFAIPGADSVKAASAGREISLNIDAVKIEIRQ